MDVFEVAVAGQEEPVWPKAKLRFNLQHFVRTDANTGAGLFKRGFGVLSQLVQVDVCFGGFGFDDVFGDVEQILERVDQRVFVFAFATDEQRDVFDEFLSVNDDLKPLCEINDPGRGHIDGS